MNPNAKIDVVAASLVPAASGSSASGDFNGSRAGEEAERAARYRLVIEEGPQAGSFIYKTLDRLTGEVVRQLPRQEVIDMMQAVDYSAGRLIDTSA